MKADINKDIEEVGLRVRLRKFDEDNILLREELARAEELITNLERQRNSLENQLYVCFIWRTECARSGINLRICVHEKLHFYRRRDRYVKKCQQLEKENDEQKDKLNEMIKNEKSYVSAHQRSTKQYESLSKQLEAAEIEVHLVAYLLLH